MDLSGLIFVALAVVWAVVLIPMALRHHDEASRTRAVDDFSDDLRVVARREAVSSRSSRLVVQGRTALRRGRRDDETPGETDPTPATLTETVTESVVETTLVSSSRTAPARHARRLTAHRAAARAAARRRRRVLAALALVTVAVAVGSLTGVLQPWAPAVPGGVVLAFLVLARVLVRREQRAWRAALAAPRADVSTPTPADAAPRVADEVSVEPLPAPVAAQSPWKVVSGLDDTCAVPVGLGTAVSGTAGPREGLWDPLPVTLPTYVTKPRAHRSVRTIDLLDPDVVSSGRNAVDSALVAEAATAAPQAPEQDRAVGH